MADNDAGAIENPAPARKKRGKNGKNGRKKRGGKMGQGKAAPKAPKAAAVHYGSSAPTVPLSLEEQLKKLDAFLAAANHGKGVVAPGRVPVGGIPIDNLARLRAQLAVAVARAKGHAPPPPVE